MNRVIQRPNGQICPRDPIAPVCGKSSERLEGIRSRFSEFQFSKYRARLLRGSRIFVSRLERRYHSPPIMLDCIRLEKIISRYFLCIPFNSEFRVALIWKFSQFPYRTDHIYAFFNCFNFISDNDLVKKKKKNGHSPFAIEIKWFVLHETFCREKKTNVI